MRRFEATCWIPREVSVGPVEVTTPAGVGEVCLVSESRIVGISTLFGASVSVTVREEDDALPDDRVFVKVRDVAMVAANRVVHVARLLSTTHRHAVPPLHESEFHALVIAEAGASPRILAAPAAGPRSIRVAKALAASDVSGRLAPLVGLGAADALWVAALEAACAGRTADAVIGARAALEAAWVATAEAAVAAHKASSTPALVVFLTAYYGEATRGTTGIKERLGRYSEALFGASFHDRWGDDRWSQVTGTFAKRNLAAHGAGAVTLDEAFQVVSYIRFALDDLARVRATYPP